MNENLQTVEDLSERAFNLILLYKEFNRGGMVEMVMRLVLGDVWGVQLGQLYIETIQQGNKGERQKTHRRTHPQTHTIFLNLDVCVFICSHISGNNQLFIKEPKVNSFFMT